MQKFLSFSDSPVKENSDRISCVFGKMLEQGEKKIKYVRGKNWETK